MQHQVVYSKNLVNLDVQVNMKHEAMTSSSKLNWKSQEDSGFNP